MTKVPLKKIEAEEGFEYVNFTIDAELLRELGERLVGKPHVALGELVKNAYDADATRCIIKFDSDSIEITDDGNGMDRHDFVGKWMRIGSTHKREERTSPILERPLTGSKGVGRLSAQFLGSRIEVRSVSRKTRRDAIEAKVNWNESYRQGSLVEAGALIRGHATRDLLPNNFTHGTSITIRGLRDVWTSDSFKNLAAELWFLQPPPLVAKELEDPERFQVELLGVDENDRRFWQEQSNAAIDNWIAKIEGSIHRGRVTGKAKIRVTFKDGEKFNAQCDLPSSSLDEARFDILIFKLTGRQTYGVNVMEARKYFKRFGGLHIYDSGFRLPFYGGDEHDWVGIEAAHSHRLIQSEIVPAALRPEGATLQDLPTLNRVFGIVRVSTTRELESAPPNTPPSEILTMQVTRDKLIDNRAFDDLVYSVRWAFDFYSYQSTRLRFIEAAKKISSHQEELVVKLETVRQRALELKSKVPARLVEPLERALDQFQDAEQKRKEEIDAERVLLGALATAGMGSVALQHELAKELRALEGVVKTLQKQLSHEKSQGLADALKALDNWVNTASQTRKMFSPFFESEDRDQLKRMRVGRVIKRLASNLSPLLRGISIEADDIPDDLKLPRGTFAGWNAVFQNLFVNSVNATLESKQKRIRCRANIDSRGRTKLVLEDTGVGVDLDDSETLFKPFVRKLELPDERKALGLGGMGIGLTIARMVCQTFGCDIKFVRPRSPFKTALEISWEDEVDGK